MRMKDIQVGETYEVGRNRGPRRGIEFSDLRGVAVKTGVNAYDSPYGNRGYVLLHALTEDGLISTSGPIMLEDGVLRDGEPRSVWAQASEVATAEMVGEKIAAKAKERALQADMQRRRREYEADVTRRLAEHMNVQPEDLFVNVLTRDDGSYHVYRVQLALEAVEKYLGTDG